MPFWERDGHLIGNDGGTALIECEDCPCGPCGSSCPTDCSGCSATMTLTISGLIGFWAILNAEYPLVRDDCTWKLDPAYNPWPKYVDSILISCADGYWYVTLIIACALAVWQSDGRNACRSPAVGAYAMHSVPPSEWNPDFTAILSL